MRSCYGELDGAVQRAVSIAVQGDASVVVKGEASDIENPRLPIWSSKSPGIISSEDTFERICNTLVIIDTYLCSSLGSLTLDELG